MDNLLAVGKVSKLFGSSGEVIINIYDPATTDNINYEEPLYVFIDGLAVPLFAEVIEKKGRKNLIVRFADIDNTLRANELLGIELYLRSHPPAQDSFMEKTNDDGNIRVNDLIGFKAVMNTDNESYKPDITSGIITGIIDNEMNPLFQIESEGKELLVPIADEFIYNIDVENSTIEFKLPDGLLELFT